MQINHRTKRVCQYSPQKQSMPICEQEISELKQARQAWARSVYGAVARTLPKVLAFAGLACAAIYAYVQLRGWPPFFVTGSMAYGLLMGSALVSAIPLALARLPSYPSMENIQNVRAMKEEFAEWKASLTKEVVAVDISDVQQTF